MRRDCLYCSAGATSTNSTVLSKFSFTTRLFTDYAAQQKQAEEKAAAHAKERKLQEAMLGVKKRYGKNAILKGMNLEEGATAKDQNEKIGGHQA